MIGRLLITVTLVSLPILVAPQTDRRLPAPAGQARRLAFVVGNDTYPSAPLRNARNDARAIAAALEELGFRVTRLQDVTRAQFVNGLASFADTLQPTDLALFFFAGHGRAVDNENFLIPVDYAGASPAQVRMSGVAASEVERTLGRARVRVLVLDACRDNAFTGTRGFGGLAPMQARGSLIAFATRANETASDNAVGGNGLFTGELVKVLREPGLGLREIFYRVRQRVNDASRGLQFPAFYDELIADVVLRPASAVSASPPVTPDADLARREEVAFWESIKDKVDATLFQEYLRQYPAGRYKLLAETRLAELRRAAAPAPAGGVAPTPPAATGRGSRVNAGGEAPANPSVGSRWTSPMDRREMAWIPPGEFMMGSPANEPGRFDSEGPQQTLRFASGFWLDGTEVTNAAYARFIEANPQWSKAGIDRKLHDGDYLLDWNGAASPAGKAEHPVAWVSWYAATAYCAWAGKRLPTESEWEYAARAGTTTAYWWGDGWDATRAVGAGAGGTQPVGNARRVNAWGLADMLGNVLEWTSTQNRPYPYRADDGREAPSGNATRVVRGGSWIYLPRSLRAANRVDVRPAAADSYVGFRCAQ